MLLMSSVSARSLLSCPRHLLHHLMLLSFSGLQRIREPVASFSTKHMQHPILFLYST